MNDSIHPPSELELRRARRAGLEGVALSAPRAVPPIGYLLMNLDDWQASALLWGVMEGRIDVADLPAPHGDDRLTFADRRTVTELLRGSGADQEWSAHVAAGGEGCWCAGMHPGVER